MLKFFSIIINPSIVSLGIFLTATSCNTGSNVKEQENAEHSSDLPTVKIAEIETGIKTYIKEKEKQGDGFFHVRDKEKELRMKLVRVHTEYLSNLGPKRHFACVDLADMSGDVYDVDFFLSGDPGEMDVTETTVHKLNGKPFYTWKQRANKTWHRVPVEGASKELLGVIEGKDQFEFRYHVELPQLEDVAKIWIPIAKSDSFQ